MERVIRKTVKGMVPTPLRRRGSGRYRWVRRLISLFIIVSFGVCIVTPLVFMKMNPSTSCSSCHCDCFYEDFLPLSCRFISYNSSEIDPEMIEELKKDRLTLIKEELDLLKAVSGENMQRSKSLISTAKKSSSDYQKEAEQCNIAVGTCENARERAEEELVEERKRTALWQKRAEMLAPP